jgi:hypothetical protein
MQMPYLHHILHNFAAQFHQDVVSFPSSLDLRTAAPRGQTLQNAREDRPLSLKIRPNGQMHPTGSHNLETKRKTNVYVLNANSNRVNRT